MACFYLSDITDWLMTNSVPSDKTVLRDAEGQIEKAIIMIGGWSKHTYLTMVNVFYPKLNKLSKFGNIKLCQPDMVTKRPILYKDCLFILGRYHIHIIDLK